MRLPADWEKFLEAELDLPAFYRSLTAFTNQFAQIIPDKRHIFHVFNLVSPQNVCCVLYGEDPYPRATSANGVAFWDAEIKSWADKTVGNSMKNILKALLVAHGLADYKTPISQCRTIALQQNLKTPQQLFRHWLKNGVLLVNVALTYSSAKDKKQHFIFWQTFHQALIKALSQLPQPPYFILWGKKAQQWEDLIAKEMQDQCKIIKNGHPTFIHQFLKAGLPTYSPFTEIERKTGFSWL